MDKIIFDMKRSGINEIDYVRGLFISIFTIAPWNDDMLGMIRDALSEISTTQNEMNVVTNEDKILAILKQDGKLSVAMLSNLIRITQRQVQRILTKLKDEGKILRHGANKNSYWEVID